MVRILVIDDEERIRELLRDVLESGGHEVELAPNGQVGLRMFRAREADLVITDIIMPEKEGIETIFELHELRPSLPIIAISGGSKEGAGSYLPTARELGACRTVTKPFSPKVLLAIISEVLASRTPEDGASV